MLRPLAITCFIFWLLPTFSQAATQEAECYGGPVPDEDFYPTGPGDGWIHQGSFRALAFPGSPSGQFNEASNWSNSNIRAAENFDPDYYRWGRCAYQVPGGTTTFYCGDASIDTQQCWSEDPFTLANTNNGETCVSTIAGSGIIPARDETIYMINIDRSGAETTYCQIEFKTLATGDPIPTDPPGTGSTRVVGLAVTDPETDQTPDGPTSPFPIYLYEAAVPFMPHILLIGMTVLLATLGLRRARRRDVA